MIIEASITFEYDIVVVETDEELNEFDLVARSEEEALVMASDMFTEDVMNMTLRDITSFRTLVDLKKS